LFDESNIFNKESDLYIYSTNQIFVFGPENGIILEGDEFKLKTIIFCNEEGVSRFNKVEGDRIGFKLDNSTGLITTVENGNPDAAIKIEAYYIYGDKRLNDSCEITIKKRIYPQNIQIVGSNRINTETAEYI
jgi:hypothetical protein